MGRARLASALAAALAGCAASPTQLIVVVDTDLPIPGVVDAIEVSVTAPDGTVHTESERLLGGDQLPATVGVAPATGDVAGGPLRIVATALDGERVVVSRRAVVTLERGRTTTISLLLRASCIGVDCSGASTCDEGRCVSDEVVPGPWQGTPPRLTSDAGSLDAGAVDAGPVDAAGPGDGGPPPCRGSEDCPPAEMGEPGACDFPGGPCDEDGERARPVRSYECRASRCEPVDAVVMEPCTRDTEGVSCGSRACDPFGECEHADACVTSGTRSRACRDRACAAGACTDVPVTETEECGMRTTEGARCNSALDCSLYECRSGACTYVSGGCNVGETCCYPGCYSTCP